MRGVVQEILKINYFGCPVVYRYIGFPLRASFFWKPMQRMILLIIIRLLLVFRMIGKMEAKRLSKLKLRKSLRTNIEYPLKKP